MPYNSSLDQETFSKFWENDTGKIIVSVHSYNNGPKKLQLARELKGKEGQPTFAKLGRLSKEEVEGILPLIKEATAAMD